MFRPNFQFFPLVVIILFLPTSFYLGYTPLIVGYVYLFSSLFCYVIYFIDKRAAKKQKQRIAENTLHTFSVLCGWPGAIVAQQWLRHKTQKVKFRRLFWVTVLLNFGLLFWLHTETGSNVLHASFSALTQLVLQTIGETTLGKIILTITAFRE